ncbi:hypothetical protein SRHO_G00000240 [Serrasalmus rhombeus]
MALKDAYSPRKAILRSRRVDPALTVMRRERRLTARLTVLCTHLGGTPERGKPACMVLRARWVLTGSGDRRCYLCVTKNSLEKTKHTWLLGEVGRIAGLRPGGASEAFGNI